jgi:hypothetical protein
MNKGLYSLPEYSQDQCTLFFQKVTVFYKMAKNQHLLAKNKFVNIFVPMFTGINGICL